MFLQDIARLALFISEATAVRRLCCGGINFAGEFLLLYARGRFGCFCALTRSEKGRFLIAAEFQSEREGDSDYRKYGSGDEDFLFHAALTQQDYLWFKKKHGLSPCFYEKVLAKACPCGATAKTRFAIRFF